MTLVNSGFHKQKDFSENYPQFGYAPSKEFASHVPDRQFLNNIGFKGMLWI
jgi:hypothetical protein